MRFRQLIICCVIFLSPFCAWAQKEANIWYFGVNAGVSFASGSPVALTNGKINHYEGCATLSNSQGRLLFYTDGVSIWDSTHNVMTNGTGLLGHNSASQSAVGIPKPGSTRYFYVFTTDAQESNSSINGLRYSEVDMTLNSGKGGVTSVKNVQLLAKTSEKLTAVKHANGVDYWILTVKGGSDTMYAYRVTSAGVNPVAVKSSMGRAINTGILWGYMKVSPDGRFIAFANGSDSVMYMPFSNSTGRVSRAYGLAKLTGSYGAEFSSTGKFLYVADYGGSGIFQFNLQSGSISTIRNSKTTIVSGFSSGGPGALQLGPDLRIYFCHTGHTYLHMIKYPDSAGSKCQYINNAVSLNGKTCRLGLPTFMQSYFKTNKINATRTCIRDTTFFTLENTQPDSVKWNFGDPNSGANNFTNRTDNIYHLYKKKGSYLVTLISFFPTNSDTAKRYIYIIDSKPFIGKDTAICGTLFQNTLSPQKDYASYKWSTSKTTKTTFADLKGTYILNVVDTNGCKSADTMVLQNPKVFASFKLSDTLLCANSSFRMTNTATYTDDVWKKSVFSFPDKSSITDTVANKIFATSDSFVIKLKAFSKFGCVDSTTKVVKTLPNTKIGFSINQVNQCFKGHSFNFSNTSTISKGSVSYSWTFGDDSSSVQKDITGKKYLKDSTYTIRLITASDKNCKDTLSKTVSIYPNTSVGFTPSKISQCYRNNGTAFANNSTIRKGAVSTYSWNFGDNTTSSKKDIANKIFANPDSFRISLLAISDKGCRDSIKKTIFIWANSIPGFSINKAAQCFRGHSFDFTNTSAISQGTMTHYWQFGDMNTSNVKDITGKTYLIDSSYTVRLITTSDKNCKDTIDKTVVVHAQPKADFTDLKPFQCFNYNRSDFLNQSGIRKGSIVVYQWDFGDTTSSGQKDINGKKYKRADSFSVILRTISDKGCRDSLSKAHHIYPNAKIGFSVNQDTQCYEWHKFIFSNSSSISKGKLDYAWTFGDGSTATSKDMNNKRYASFGEYNVRLITSSGMNCHDTLQKHVVLHASPVADFTFDKARQCFRGNKFNFTNLSSINNGVISANNWDMGDAQTFSKLHVTNYSYNTEDSFLVELVTVSDKGCRDSARTLTVTFAQPVASFIVPNDTQCWRNNFFNIKNTTTLKYGSMSHEWNFGDGTFDYTSEPQTKKYPNKSAGYTISYKVVSNNGCRDSAKHTIILLERPQSDFTVNDSVQCFNTCLFSFTNVTTFSAMNTLTYYWDYGNGVNSAGINAQDMTYAVPQYYLVTLISHSSLTNCYDTLRRYVLPAPHAQVDFTINKDSQCFRNNKYDFSNLSKVKLGTITYRWDFRDGSTDITKNPSKHYTTGAKYIVKLVATTNHNCSDSIEKPLVLVPHPKAGFTVSDSAQCYNQHAFDLQNNSTLLYGALYSKWLFDDATESTQKDISGKQFNVPGFHKVILAMNSSFGCTDTARKQVYLERDKNTIATISGKDSQCMKGNLFTSAANGLYPEIQFASWQWDFGDGNTSAQSSPTHHFIKEGKFRISLKTLSKNGCTDSGSVMVIVHPHPVSAFKASSPCFPEPVIFTNHSKISSGSIVSTSWDFYDGTFSKDNDPEKIYDTWGKFDTRLISKSGYGCSDTLFANDSVLVRQKPNAQFTYKRLESGQFEKTRVKFINQSSIDVVQDYWDFGNGLNSTESDPVYDFSDTGSRLVTLYVSNSDQCSDTFSLRTATLIPDFFFFLPDAFSPSESHSGLNDIYKPASSQYIYLYRLEIFNRWGEKVFSTTDITQGWDGTYKGEPCEQGVYLCKAYVVPLFGKLKHIETSLTLLR